MLGLTQFCKKNKFYPSKFISNNVLLIWLVAFALYSAYSDFYGGWFGNNGTQGKETMPLLLNSGQTQVAEAEMRITLWFESSKPPLELTQSLPQEGWEWEISDLKTTQGKERYSYSGYKKIGASEEEAIYTWFKGISEKVESYGGTAYLDERIMEGIDLAKYSVYKDITPVQWALSDSFYSLSGRKKDMVKPVQAGSDTMNIQLITKSDEGKGKTALAIPVLLEEF